MSRIDRSSTHVRRGAVEIARRAVLAAAVVCAVGASCAVEDSSEPNLDTPTPVRTALLGGDGEGEDETRDGDSDGDKGKDEAADQESIAEATAVRFVIDREANEIGTPSCVSELCVYWFTNPDLTLTGDLEGIAVSSGAGAPLPGGGYGGTGYVVFTGTVAACGGSGIVAWTDSVVQESDGSISGSWMIVEGSGTGALAQLRGGGAGALTESDLAPDGSGQVVVEGSLRCE